MKYQISFFNKKMNLQEIMKTPSQSLIPSKRTTFLLVLSVPILCDIFLLYSSHRNIVALDYVNHSKNSLIFDTTITTTTTTAIIANNDVTNNNATTTYYATTDDATYATLNDATDDATTTMMTTTTSYKTQNQLGQVSFFDDDGIDDDDDTTTEKKCWISFDNATFVGCGEQGQTYMIQMNCRRLLINENDTNTNTTNITITTRKDVILKLSTRKGKREVYKFKELSSKRIRRYKKMYKALFNNDDNNPTTTTTTNSNNNNENDESSSLKGMHQHFHLGYATVQIDIIKLLSNLKNNFTDSFISRPCGDIVHYYYNNNNDIPPQNETGMIMSVAKGDRLFDHFVVVKNNTTTTSKRSLFLNSSIQQLNPKHHPKYHRRTIINQLTCMWNHMYKHNFIHDDVTSLHIYWDGQTVSLIDFPDETTILDEKWNKEDEEVENDDENENNSNSNNIRLLLLHEARMLQLYQLLGLISNVCMDETNYIEVRRAFKTTAGIRKTHGMIEKVYSNRRGPKKKNYINNKIRLALKQCFSDDDDDNNENSNNESENEEKQHNDDNASFFFETNNNRYYNVSSGNVPYIIPRLFYEHYQQLMYQITTYRNDQNNTTNTNERSITDDDVVVHQHQHGGGHDNNNNNDYDYDYDVVGQIYDILFHWSGGNGRC